MKFYPLVKIVKNVEEIHLKSVEQKKLETLKDLCLEKIGEKTNEMTKKGESQKNIEDMQSKEAKLMEIKLNEIQLKQDLPVISVGDTVRVGVSIQEGKKERVQPYEGTVIAQHKAGLSTTITVRQTFQGVGVERILLLYSPSVQNIKVLRHAKVRKAKLYYLRERVGKGTRLKR